MDEAGRDEDFIRVSRRLLYETVALLAADARAQEEWLGRMSVDEFFIDFDNYWHPSRRELLGLPDEARRLLDEIGQALEGGDADMSSRDALHSDDRWAVIRDLAARALPLLPSE